MKRELPDELKFLTNRNLPQKTNTVSLAGKICVLTGATSGVGLAAARSLAARGAYLVLVCRNPVKADQVAKEIKAAWNTPVDLILADFSDLEQVRQCAAALLARYPRIDLLINCAGLHSTRLTYTSAGFETVFCVNHLASFLLTSLLLDRLKKSAPARIIQVNSEGHRFNGLDPDDLNWQKRHYTGLRGYGASKSAQLLTVLEFTDILRGTGVTINAMHPGDVRTRIGQNNGWLYRIFQRQVIWHFLRDPALSGEAIAYLATAPELDLISGRFFHLTHEEKPARHALDRQLSRRIWDISRRMTGLSQ